MDGNPSYQVQFVCVFVGERGGCECVVCVVCVIANTEGGRARARAPKREREREREREMPTYTRARAHTHTHTHTYTHTAHNFPCAMGQVRKLSARRG